MYFRRFVLLTFFCVLSSTWAQPVSAQNRFTVLNDAFGDRSNLEQDWGYAALIEFEGKRILFDTGDNIQVFRKNVEAMHVDLTRLDMVIITHAHGDHTSGLRYVLAKNPKVKLFVPDDQFFTGSVLPPAFLTKDARPELPAKMRYFRGGSRPEPSGWLAWSDTNMTAVSESIAIAPHMRLISLVSEKSAFKGLREISLVLDTHAGPIIFAGCSHPGIERILAEATAHNASKDVSMVAGGLHLLQDTPEQIDATLNALKDTYHVKAMAIGHCSGELTFEKVQQRWGRQSEYAGLGETILF